MIEEVAPKDVAERIAAGESIVIVDVREPSELEICKIDGALHVPLGDVPARQQEFEPDQLYAFLCHHGIRSANAAGFMQAQGLEKLINISGGIDRWAAEVDASMARY